MLWKTSLKGKQKYNDKKQWLTSHRKLYFLYNKYITNNITCWLDWGNFGCMWCDIVTQFTKVKLLKVVQNKFNKNKRKPFSKLIA